VDGPLFLQPLDFFAHALDLLGILGKFQRFAVAHRGAVDPAGLFVGIAQMFDDRRIVHGKFRRAFKLLDGARVIALLIVNPTQAVDVETVVGRDLERPHDQIFGFVELHAHLCPGITQVVERRRVLGLSMAFFILAMIIFDFALVVSAAQKCASSFSGSGDDTLHRLVAVENLLDLDIAP
jgi:hypothetical protein